MRGSARKAVDSADSALTKPANLEDLAVIARLADDLARAQALGMTYRQYTAVLLDRGVHL